MTKEELKQARELCEGVPSGPWITREDHDYYQGGTYICSADREDICRIHSNDSEIFLLESRTIIPKLLDYIERLQMDNEEMNDRLEDIGYRSIE